MKYSKRSNIAQGTSKRRSAVHFFAAQQVHPQGVALRGVTWAGPQKNEPHV